MHDCGADCGGVGRNTVKPSRPQPPPATSRIRVTKRPEYLVRLEAVLDSVPEAAPDIGRIVTELWKARDRDATVWILGNGGSQANAQHLVLHLRESKIKAFDLLADNASATALANDYSYATACEITLTRLARKDDVLVVISGSGNSANIVTSAKTANALQMKTLGLLGNDGGEVLVHCIQAVVLPGLDYGPLEDAMSAIIHMISDTLKAAG